MCNSVKVGNVQPHSAGELFPWMITVIDRNGSGICIPYNGETNMKLAGVVYDKWEDFTTAHQAAEQAIRNHLRNHD
jgi:hypothetical protein